MARTFIRQASQIRKSDAYIDNLAPTQANYETGPVTIEDDLNSIRSSLNTLLQNRLGNWYDDLVAPSALDNGTQRGVNSLNTDLHALERKRVLVQVANLFDLAVPAGQNFVVISNASALPSNTTAAIGSVTTAGSVFAAAVAPGFSGTLNLGTLSFNVVTPQQTQVVASYNNGQPAGTATVILDSPANVVVEYGDTTLGSTIALALSSATNVTSATLTSPDGPAPNSGSGFVITQPTSTFNQHSLAEVAGGNAIAPKNLMVIVDADSRDPILSDNRKVYGLAQSESSIDGSTVSTSGPNRIQISFVRVNAAGDDLEAVPVADIENLDVNISYVERKALEDLNEQDFLNGAIVDVPATTTVTRQIGYDNQGATPVDLTTNAILDLEGAGLVWKIRDDLENDLFLITEGSAGGTSTIEISSDVDQFDVNAVIVDVTNGATLNDIKVGVTGGTIETNATFPLTVRSGEELYLDDVNRVGSTWTQTGVKLSESTAEWDAYEVQFGGEVSLFAAITAAAASGGRGTKTYANVLNTTNADQDVAGAAGGTNLDAQLQDMSSGDFLIDYDVYLNGNLLRPGANSGTNNDYYPGSNLVFGQLRFEFQVVAGDVICVIPY
jgi:hypothetical protein